MRGLSRVQGAPRLRTVQEIERQKLLEVAAFFVAKTRHCGLVKLFKLLYYTDMLHFRETGRGVTGLVYQAWPYGPVPPRLYEEIQQPEPDMRAVLSIQSPPRGNADESSPRATKIAVVRDPGTGDLTKRELRIVREVAEMFRDVTAEQISDISHAKNGPWDKAKKAGSGKWGHPIEFLDSVNLKFGTGAARAIEELAERAADYAELREHFG